MASTSNVAGAPPARRGLNPRLVAYAAFALLILLPVVAFAVGPLTSDSFDLEGPAGPMLAFSAGVLSFVSPCVLPLVPVYITHLSGASVEAGVAAVSRQKTFTHAVAFIAGLTFVFVALGTSVGLLGSYFLQDHQRDFEQVAGVMLVLLGLLLVHSGGRRSPLRAAVVLVAVAAAYFALAELADLRGDRSRLALLGAVMLIAWLRFSGFLQVPLLARTFEVPLARDRRVGYGQSALVGGAFALGWTPCVGPILGGILTLAATSSGAWQGTYLLLAYSAGFAVPFLITGLALADATRFLKRINPYLPFIEAASGVLLIGIGTLLITGRLTSLNSYFDFADFNQGL